MKEVGKNFGLLLVEGQKHYKDLGRMSEDSDFDS